MTLTTSPDRQAPAFLGGGPGLLHIAGEWRAPSSGEYRDSVDPSTGTVVCRIAEANTADVDSAVDAARQALTGPWASFTPYQRQRLLNRMAEVVDAHAEDLALLESLDMGAPVSRTRPIMTACVQLLHWYAANAVTLHGRTVANSAPGHPSSWTVREPVGVVAAIIPWNSPTIASIWKIGPVLATGCTLILKPAEDTPLVSLRLGDLCARAGVPPGVVNVITGAGPVVGAHLAEHPGVDKISFTGSLGTGRTIAAAAATSNLKRVTLELGGKSANIVFDDADLAKAVPGAAAGIFTNSGQICSAGSRLFVHARIHDEFVERLAQAAETMSVGDPFDPNTRIGPLASRAQLDRVCQFLDAADREGATAITGGARLSGPGLDDGFFVPPTVYVGVDDGMEIAREEIFGPVASVLRFDTEEEAVARANASRFGLGAGVWTRDIGRAHRVAAALQAGSVWVNCYQRMDPAMPFGGYKESGWGREGGLEQFEEYLNTKAVWVDGD